MKQPFTKIIWAALVIGIVSNIIGFYYAAGGNFSTSGLSAIAQANFLLSYPFYALISAFTLCVAGGFIFIVTNINYNFVTFILTFLMSIVVLTFVTVLRITNYFNLFETARYLLWYYFPSI